MSWTLVLDDNFAHADTTAGAANSTTGVPTTPTTGQANGWTDMVGGRYSIASNTLLGLDSSSGSGYPTQVLLRPSGEATGTDQRVVFYGVAANTTDKLAGVLRWASSGNFYLAEFDPAAQGKLTIYRVSGSSPTVLGQVAATATAGHLYAIDFRATGSSPTSLSLKAYDLTALSLSSLPEDTSSLTASASASGSDSASAMQATGLRLGLDAYQTNIAIHFSRAQAYQAAASATGYTLAVAPTSGTVGSSATVTVAPTPSGGVFTGSISVAKSGAGLSGTTTLTFSNSSAAQTFTIAPSSAGTATLTPTNSGGLTDPAAATYVAAILPVAAFDGDSLTYGQGAGSGAGTTSGTTYPADAMAYLGSGWASAGNFGVQGQTIVDMTSDAATQVDPVRTTPPQASVLFAWGGNNDIRLGGSAATAYSRLVAYCQARRGAGWKVVVLTVLKANGTSYQSQSPAFNASVAALNASIRAGWWTFADALADVAADSRLSDPANATYFNADMVHLTDPGYAVVASIATAAANVAINPPTAHPVRFRRGSN